jgi:hypothetical protein
MRTFGEANGIIPIVESSELLAAIEVWTNEVRTIEVPAAGQNSLVQLSALVEQIQAASRAAQKLVLGREPVDLTWRSGTGFVVRG